MTNSKPLQTKRWLALLATLFVIVLIAHLTLISSARGQLGTIKSVSTEAFTTRMIELPTILPAPETAAKVVMPAPRRPKLVNPVTTAATLPIAPPVPTETAAMPEPPAQIPAIPPNIPTPPPILADPVPAPVTSSVSAPDATLGDTNVTKPAYVAPNTGLHIYKFIFTINSVVNQGKAIIEWRQDGERYLLNVNATYLGFDAFTWASKGLISPAGLLPERYSDKRRNKSEVASHFDRVSGKIIFSANTPHAMLENGAQDRVSIMWQLAGLLAANPERYPIGTTIAIQTADDKEAQTWLFTVNETETLNLENGSQIALRLTRNPRREFDRKIEFWFAPAMGYLPIRFRQTQTNGNYEDLVWQGVQPLPNVSN